MTDGLVALIEFSSSIENASPGLLTARSSSCTSRTRFADRG